MQRHLVWLFGVVLWQTDASSAYWAEPDPDAVIGKVSVDGGTPIALASGQHGPVAIAVDATSIYWLNSLSGAVMKLTPK